MVVFLDRVGSRGIARDCVRLRGIAWDCQDVKMMLSSLFLARVSQSSVHME